MRRIVAKAKRRLEGTSDSGMSLAELLTVIAIGAVIMGIVTTVTVSLARHDARNLVRQSRVDGIRQVSVWLGDALAHAAPKEAPSNPDQPLATVFETAEGQKMVFYAALPVAGSPDGGLVSRVTLVLGEGCWSGSEAAPGILHRCVQAPKVDSSGASSLCAHGAIDCPDDLFEDLIVARGVKDEALFSYFLRGNDGQIADKGEDTVASASLGSIGAVEVLATVAGKPGDPGGAASTEATVFKRFTIREWERL
ncbi:MAG: prepilin-type N-terminal cleavage/methylation domain-containing protein [Bifidobacteriaceae bacterium]|jgi:prepilin-type N-terminal cleavage/methylation domain-containing protein|nr:prepilin-type N-terminal cleavage/methylation domain-containing protein [Bifidobacteriaceae bacterium]